MCYVLSITAKVYAIKCDYQRSTTTTVMFGSNEQIIKFPILTITDSFKNHQIYNKSGDVVW